MTDMPAFSLPDREDLLRDASVLPTPPAIVLQIVRLVADENVSIGKIADSVALDAPLAGRVLKAVNSAAYSPRSRIVRLDQAVSLLGLKRFRSLLMSSAMSGMVPAGEDAASQIRRRTIINATLSKAFAEEVNPSLSEEAFLGGLLGALGHLVFARRSPDAHRHLCDAGGNWPTPDGEQELLGYLIDDVTADLLTTWAMPEILSEGIKLRSMTRQDWIPRETDADLVTSLRLGLLAERVLCGTDPGESLKVLLDVGRRVLGLELLRLSEILVGTEPLVVELGRSMNFDVPAEGEHEAVLAEAMQLIEGGGDSLTPEAEGLANLPR
jgi:HD-like signal output (HDOD) protein